MPLTEQELHDQLEKAADQALPPRFTVADLSSRIRRRRTRQAAALTACLAVVAAAAVAIPVALAGHAPLVVGQPGTTLPGSAKLGPPRAEESAPAPRLRPVVFTVTVNGQRPSLAATAQPKPPKGCGRTPADPCPATLGPGFAVRPGERLSIRIAVTIPVRARIAGLWLGISDGTFGWNGSGPVGLQPILARIRSGLEPGRRTFLLSWTVPDGTTAGTTLWLAASWDGMLPVADPAGSHQLTSGSFSALVTVFVCR